MMATERLRRALERPVPADSLVAFRVAFGLLMAVAVARFFAHGWIDALFVAPGYHFAYDGFQWVRPWPRPFMHLHFAVMGAAALAVAAGYRYRASLAVLLAAFLYVELLDKTTYLNHYYLVSLLGALLLLVPLDRTRPKPGLAPFWQLGMLRLQVGLVYVFAGVAKLKADWIFEAEPLRTWLAAAEGLPLLGPLLTLPWVPWAASWGAAAMDLAAPFLLARRATRPFMYAVLIAFHVVTSLLFNLGLFPFIMLAAATLFFPPDWPRASSRRAAAAPPPAPARLPPLRPRRGVLYAALALHFAFQLAWPLRHLARDGDVTWSEDGFRFAWNVMLIEKNGYLAYDVVAPEGDRSWRVYPQDELTPLQTKMLATQPDMILQYAHKIAADFAARGLPGVRVHADSWASLNGRPAARLVDPQVDLAALSGDRGHRWWVLNPSYP